MFRFNSDSEMMRIGPRNVEAVKARLKHHSIPLIAENTGGNCGRTIEFNVETSELFIRTVSKCEQIIYIYMYNIFGRGVLQWCTYNIHMVCGVMKLGYDH